MTNAQKEGLAQLMREHFKQEADDILLKQLLDRERISGKVLADWRTEFTRGQQDEAYHRLIQEGEAYVAEVLAAIERNEAISAFLKNPPKGPSN